MAKPALNAPSWLVARPIAHRGLHDLNKGIVENSLSAAQAALAHGFAIECDVQLTRDDEVVVFHDFTLDRLTAKSGNLADQTADQLGRIRLRDSADIIAPLNQYLSMLNGAVPLVIEIKSRFDGDMRLTQRTAAIVADYAGPVALKSFDPAIVQALRRLAPQRPRGIVAMLGYDYPDYSTLSAAQKHEMANLLHFADTRPDFLSWRVGDLPCAAPFLCRTALGLPVMTWTVRSPADRATALAHADQMVFEGFLPESASA